MWLFFSMVLTLLCARLFAVLGIDSFLETVVWITMILLWSLFVSLLASVATEGELTNSV